MKPGIYTGAQMKALDSYTIEHCGQTGLALMENAAACIVREIEKRIALAGKVCVILCGKGNNGGDGFAAALLLRVRCAAVRIVCLQDAMSLSPDAAYYSARAGQYGIERISDLSKALDAIAEADVILDALYGFGFRGTLAENDALLVSAANDAKGYVVSADIPSGVSADCGNVSGVCIRADLTVTFTGYKLSAVLFESRNYYGEIAVADIGIPDAAKEKHLPTAEVVLPQAVLHTLGVRRRNAHKGDCGKAFILGGSSGMSGAVYMSAQAALRSGAGLVCAGVPQHLSEIMEIKTTEAMTCAFAANGEGLGADASVVEKVNAYDATAFGMGAGRNEAIVQLLTLLLQHTEKPLVIDADGLYALAQNKDLLSAAKAPVVLTPHSGEMARLCEKRIAEVEADRIGCAQQFAKTYGVYVVLKGACTVIASPDGNVAVNCLAGNSGMATAGSGDVLSGICAALLARIPDVYAAIQAAVYIHALAGDLAAADKGEDGMIAGDMLQMLPYAIKKLRLTEQSERL